MILSNIRFTFSIYVDGFGKIHDYLRAFLCYPLSVTEADMSFCTVKTAGRRQESTRAGRVVAPTGSNVWHENQSPIF